jgi:hypothetical protein
MSIFTTFRHKGERFDDKLSESRRDLGIHPKEGNCGPERNTPVM